MASSFPLGEFVEEGNGVYAFAGTNLRISPANPGEGFGAPEQITDFLPSGGIHHDDRRAAADGESLRSTGLLDSPAYAERAPIEIGERADICIDMHGLVPSALRSSPCMESVNASQ